jgi:hypothetical protein
LNPTRIARYIALAVAVLLCGIGILHDVVNIRSVNRAVARGEIAERLGAQLIANVALAGVALVLLGFFLLLVAPDLAKGKRLAWRVAMVVGTFLVFSGIAGYWWQPIPAVFIFSILGAVLAAPLLIWRKHFRIE